MDSVDLLARENEFKKLNRQLEKKTESLMKEIEHVMQKQDMFPDFSQNLSITPSPKHYKKHSCDSSKVSASVSGNSGQNNVHQRLKFANNKTKEIIKDVIIDKTIVHNREEHCDLIKQSNSNCTEQFLCHNCMIDKNGRLSNDLEFLYAFVSINVTEKILPKAFLKERVTVESVCKFLSAKVKLLEEQICKMQNAMDQKTKQCEGHLNQLAELESERMTLKSKAKNMHGLADDAKAKYTLLQNRLEGKERAFKEQRSVTDRLSVEVKQLRSKNASLEARCAAQEDAVETLKQQLEIARTAEKEFRDSSRQLSASHQNAICRLEARVKQLTGCIDKQNSLIDNLKRQIALLITEGALKHLEKEYDDFLNQDI